MSSNAGDCVHLTVGIVKEIHAAVIDAYGGLRGVRDEGLLSSATAAPQATIAGRSPYADVIEIAAAYLFYLCRNHALNDGNKRAAMTSAIVFLRLNGVEPAADSEDWETLVLEVAASRTDRDRTTARLRRLVSKPSAAGAPRALPSTARALRSAPRGLRSAPRGLRSAPRALPNAAKKRR